MERGPGHYCESRGAVMNKPENKRRNIYINDSLWTRIVALATAGDRTVASWIRQALEKAVKKEGGK